MKRVVIASNDKAYGRHEALPYTEEMQLAGRNPYDVSKACADLIAQAYHHTYELPVAIARCGYVYGGGDLNWSRIVPGTVRAFLEGKRLIVRSDGSHVRDYIYIQDAVDAYVSIAEALDRPEVRGEAFNFGNELPVTVLELVGEIQAQIGCAHLEPRVQSMAEGEIHSQYLSASKAKEVLDWHPAYDLRSGLAKTIEWYREFLAI